MVNPSPVVLDSGKIILFYEIFPHKYHARAEAHKGIKMMDSGYNQGTTQHLLMRSSVDNGATWSAPVDLTRIARKEDENSVSAGSPANGIQIQNGEFNGRIIMPLLLSWRLSKTKRTFKSAVLYSDDDGINWKRSEFVPLGDDGIACDENLVSEISNGKIIMNARASDQFRRISISEDGGVSWSPFTKDEKLEGSPCNCGLISFKSNENNNLQLFTRNYSKGGFLYWS